MHEALTDAQSLTYARLAVAHVRDELQASTARIPWADELAWRSLAATEFDHRLDELRCGIRGALSALDAAADELLRAPARPPLAVGGLGGPTVPGGYDDRRHDGVAGNAR